MKKLFALALAALAVVTLIPGQGAAAPQKSAAMAETSGVGAAPVDLNTAGVDELQAVRGVGPSLAAKIVDLRTRRGGFSSLEDLLEIRGIGPKSLEKLRPAVTLTAPPSPVAQNPAPTSLP
jgi:comEA protein